MAACGSDDDGNADDTPRPPQPRWPAKHRRRPTPSHVDARGDRPSAADTTAAEAPAASGLDPTFGIDGLLATPVSETDNDRFISVVEGPDGQIYARVSPRSATTTHSPCLASTPMEPPTTPSVTAEPRPSTSPSAAEARRSHAASSCRTTARWSSAGPFEKDPTAEGQAAGDLDVAVIRLDANGALDATFGEGRHRQDRPRCRPVDRRRDLHHRQRVGPHGPRRRLCRVRCHTESGRRPHRHRLRHRRSHRHRRARHRIRHRTAW